jgi:hypothetical protein
MMIYRNTSIALIVLATACGRPATIPTDRQKASSSVKDSKKNKVFRNLLTVNKSIVSMGENGIDTIREIWVENEWMLTEKGDIVMGSAPQLVLLFGNASRRYDGIFLRCGKTYFAWSGVFFSAYHPLRDTIYLVSTDSGSEKVTDSVVVNAQ